MGKTNPLQPTPPVKSGFGGRTLGWNVAEHEIHDAARYLKKLGLVRRTEK